MNLVDPDRPTASGIGTRHRVLDVGEDLNQVSRRLAVVAPVIQVGDIVGYIACVEPDVSQQADADVEQW